MSTSDKESVFHHAIETAEALGNTPTAAQTYHSEPMVLALHEQERNSALILVHNHPSGDPTPSEQDIAVTSQISDAAGTMGIALHDHLIIGKSRELSFRSTGLL